MACGARFRTFRAAVKMPSCAKDARRRSWKRARKELERHATALTGNMNNATVGPTFGGMAVGAHSLLNEAAGPRDTKTQPCTALLGRVGTETRAQTATKTRAHG
jgi:hypothetical protein